VIAPPTTAAVTSEPKVAPVEAPVQAPAQESKEIAVSSASHGGGGKDPFTVGDFVKIRNDDGTESEGLVMEVVDLENIVVDVMSEGLVKECHVSKVDLVVHSDTMEVGDQVQVQPNGSAMFFVGRISEINQDGTYDVVMEGDDPDDIERSVKSIHIRKLMSRRAIVIARWKRAAMVVSSMHNFQSFAINADNFTASQRDKARDT
jgi:hypothetical protein